MSDKKKVIVFTTGGTIAMKFDLVWINLLMLKSESFQIMLVAR